MQPIHYNRTGSVLCVYLTSTTAQSSLYLPPSAKLRKAQEQYRRLLGKAGEGSGRGQPRGGADSSHHPTVASRQGQNSRGRGKAERRRAKSASSCNDHVGLSKVTVQWRMHYV